MKEVLTFNRSAYRAWQRVESTPPGGFVSFVHVPPPMPEYSKRPSVPRHEVPPAVPPYMYSASAFAAWFGPTAYPAPHVV